MGSEEGSQSVSSGLSKEEESSRVVTGGVRADLLEDSKVLNVFIC